MAFHTNIDTTLKVRGQCVLPVQLFPLPVHMQTTCCWCCKYSTYTSCSRNIHFHWWSYVQAREWSEGLLSEAEWALLARYVYTYEDFVIVTKAPQCNRMTATGQDTDNKRTIYKQAMYKWQKHYIQYWQLCVRSDVQIWNGKNKYVWWMNNVIVLCVPRLKFRSGEKKCSQITNRILVSNTELKTSNRFDKVLRPRM